jgi:hypothetical protein
MRLKSLLIAVSVFALCGAAGSVRAQQSESSVASGQTQPPEVKEFQDYEDQ